MINILQNYGFAITKHNVYNQIADYSVSCGIINGEIIEDTINGHVSIKMDGHKSQHFTEQAEAHKYLSMIAEEAESVDIRAMVRKLSSEAQHILRIVMTKYVKSKKRKDQYTSREFLEMGSISEVRKAVHELVKREFVFITGQKPRLVYNFDKTKLDSLLTK